MNPTENLSAAVSALADRYVDAYFAHRPELATFYALPGAAHDRLFDNSPAGLAAWEAEEDALWSALQAVDPAALAGSPAWVTHGFLTEALQASRGKRVVRAELWPVSQMGGWQIRYPQLAAVQPVGTPEARQAALARWSGFPRFLQNEIEALREGLRLGYSTPRRNAALVIEQIDGLLALPLERSPLFSPAQRAADEAFRTRWEALLRGQILPAVAAYNRFLAQEYLPAAREEIALTAHPEGEAAYQALLREETTLPATAAEIFRRGQEAVARNQARMRELGAKLLGTSDLAALRERITADGANHFADREEMLSFCHRALARAQAAIPAWFGLLPRAGVTIEPIPEREEKATSSNYRPAPEDGSRAAVYNLNLFQPEKQGRGAIEVQVFHEAYPGHHLQIAISRERPQAHAVTRLMMNGAYVEGWARYAEALADEMGLYETPYARVGRLAWPARGMVVDPGLHVFGWTREQALQYVLEAGTMPIEMASSLIDRIVIMPAQLTSYDTGGLEVFALRHQAEEALGARFDPRRFHDIVLEDGSITLTMLRKKVEEWIADGEAVSGQPSAVS